jgi:hypothetical protein
VKVIVGYSQSSAGAMVANTLGFVGASTVTETVTSLASDGSSLTDQGVTGNPVTYETAGAASLLSGLADGDSLQITYTSSKGVRTVRSVKVLSVPTPTAVTGTVTAIGTGGQSLTVQTSTGQTLTVAAVDLASTISGLAGGQQVQLGYVTLPNGTLLALSVTDQSTTGSGVGTGSGGGTGIGSGTGDGGGGYPGYGGGGGDGGGGYPGYGGGGGYYGGGYGY